MSISNERFCEIWLKSRINKTVALLISWGAIFTCNNFISSSRYCHADPFDPVLCQSHSPVQGCSSGEAVPQHHVHGEPLRIALWEGPGDNESVEGRWGGRVCVCVFMVNHYRLLHQRDQETVRVWREGGNVAKHVNGSTQRFCSVWISSPYSLLVYCQYPGVFSLNTWVFLTEYPWLGHSLS